MECVQILANPVKLAAGQRTTVAAHHDDYDMTFQLRLGEEDGEQSAPLMDACHCGVHRRALNRLQIGRLNDPRRWTYVRGALLDENFGASFSCFALFTSVLTIHTGCLHRGLKTSRRHPLSVSGLSFVRVRSFLPDPSFRMLSAKRKTFLPIFFSLPFIGRLGQLCLMSMSWAAKHSHRRTVILDSNAINRRTADQIARDLDGCVLARRSHPVDRNLFAARNGVPNSSG
jgi:hypothetical protein